MLLAYFFTSLMIGFFISFFSIGTILYSLMVMLRRGPGFAVFNAIGICLAQCIWVVATIAILFIFGKFYDPSSLNYWWDGLVAAVVLFAIAYWFLKAKPENSLEHQPSLKNKKLGFRQCGTGFVLVITAPQWVAGYLLILSTFDIALQKGQWILGTGVGLGLIIGVILFWFFALFIFKLVKAKATPRMVFILNRIAAGIMILLGLFALMDSIRQFI